MRWNQLSFALSSIQQPMCVEAMVNKALKTKETECTMLEFRNFDSIYDCAIISGVSLMIDGFGR